MNPSYGGVCGQNPPGFGLLGWRCEPRWVVNAGERVERNSDRANAAEKAQVRLSSAEGEVARRSPESWIAGLSPPGTTII